MTDADRHEWLRLDEGETIHWRSQPRIFETVPWLLFAAVLVVVGLVGAHWGPFLIGALVPVGFFVGVWAILANRRTWYVVTSRGLYRKTGVLGRTVRSVEYGRVQNSQFSQSITGSLFGHGSVEVEVAGGRDIGFDGIYDPGDLQATIRERSGAADRDRTSRRDLPGTREEWVAVRDELRGIRRALESNQ